MSTVFLSALFILFSGTMSSTLEAETISVDLNQALHRALQTDPRLREGEQNVNVAQAMEQDVSSTENLLFDANFFVGLAPKRTNGMSTTNSSGQIVPHPNEYNFEGIAPWYNLPLGIVKPLFSIGNSFENNENYSAAIKENVSAKQGDVALIKMQIKYDVYHTYYSYLAARDSHLLLEDTKGRLEKAIGLVEKWLRERAGNTEQAGNAKQTDVFALQTGAALVNRYLAEFQGTEKIALSKLKTLIGLDLSKKLEITEKTIAPIELPKETLKELQQKARTNQPNLEQHSANLNARRNLRKTNQSNIIPNIYATLMGSFATTPSYTTQNDPFVYDAFNYIGATSSVVGLNWDRNNGRHLPEKIEQAQATIDGLVEKSVFAQQDIALQVAEQYQFVLTHYTMVEELAKGSRAGRRWMISSYADFEAGLEKAEKIMTAFQGYILAHTNYLKAVNDFNMHVIRLKSVTGEL